MSPPQPHARTAGFTLAELLVVVAILGILLLVGSYSYVKSVRNSNNAAFVEALAQDINRARSTSMAKGMKTLVTFTSATEYVTAQLNTATPPVATRLAGTKNTAVTMSDVDPGDYLQCSPTGFCLAYNASGALKTIDHVNVSYNGKTRRLTITVLGLTRVES